MPVSNHYFNKYTIYYEYTARAIEKISEGLELKVREVKRGRPEPVNKRFFLSRGLNACIMGLIPRYWMKSIKTIKKSKKKVYNNILCKKEGNAGNSEKYLA